MIRCLVPSGLNLSFFSAAMYCLQSQRVVERAFYNQFISTYQAPYLIQPKSRLIVLSANMSTKTLGLELNLAVLGWSAFTEYESMPLCVLLIHASPTSDLGVRELRARVRFPLNPPVRPFELLGQGLVFLDLER